MLRSFLIVVSVAVLASACEQAAESYVSGDGTTAPKLRRLSPLGVAPLIPVDSLWMVRSVTWNQPTRISVTAEHIAVVDPQLNQVHLVRLTDGSFLPSVGREGRGPGEWTGLRHAVLVENELVVSLSSTTDLQVHALTGQLLRTIELGQTSLQLLQGSADVFFSRGTGARDPEFSRVELRSGAVRTFDPGQPTYSVEQFGNCWKHTAIGDGILRMSCTAGRFERIGENGAIVRWLEWPDEPIRASEVELDQYMERFWQLRGRGRTLTPLVQRQLSVLREQSAIKERYHLLRADVPTGRILVVEQEFGEYATDPGILHVLSPEGRHIGRINIDSAIQDAATYGEYLIVLVRDLATDELGLSLWRMHLPS